MTSKGNRAERPAQNLRNIGRMTMIPMVMVAGLLVGCFFGIWVDRTFGWDPWGKLSLSLLGVIAGFRQTVRLIQQSMKENERG